MTLNEVKQFFGTGYKFQKLTGMCHDNYRHWEKKGYVPIETQLRLEKFTKGALKASFEHLGAK